MLEATPPPVETPHAAETPPPQKELTSEQRAFAKLDELQRAATSKAETEAAVAPAAAAQTDGEKPKEAPPEKPPEPSDAAKRFAIIAKKEAGVISQQQKLKAERDAFEAEKRQATGLVDTIKGARTNVQRFLELGGLTIEDIIAAKAANTSAIPDAALRQVKDELAALRKEREDAQAKAQKDSQEVASAQVQAALSAFRESTKQFFIANEATHFHCLEQGEAAVETCVALTEELYKRSANPPTTREGLDKIEKEARDLTEKHFADIHSKIEARKSKLKSGQASPPAEKGTQQTAPATPKPPALSNGLARSTPPAKAEKKNGSRAKEQALLEVLNKAMAKQ